MANLVDQLNLDRCPHCKVDTPLLNKSHTLKTTTYDGRNERTWRTYSCARCGGVILATAAEAGQQIEAMYPDAAVVSDAIPEPARNYLKQALNSLHAPAGSVMLSASAVDAMLKDKGYKKGELYKRINQARDDHLITPDMATWAHEVRLDSNEPRHADEKNPLPTPEDAEKCVNFTLALAEFLYVLPSRVQRGLQEATETEQEESE